MPVTTFTTSRCTSGKEYRTQLKKNGSRPLTSSGSPTPHHFIDFTPPSRLLAVLEEEYEPQLKSKQRFHHLPTITPLRPHTRHGGDGGGGGGGGTKAKRNSTTSLSSLTSDRTLLDTLTVFSRDSSNKQESATRPQSSRSANQTFISLGPPPVGPMIVDKNLLTSRRPGTSSGLSIKTTMQNSTPSRSKLCPTRPSTASNSKSTSNSNSTSTSNSKSTSNSTSTSKCSPISPRLSVYPEGSPPTKKRKDKFRDAVGTNFRSEKDLMEALGFEERFINEDGHVCVLRGVSLVDRDGEAY